MVVSNSISSANTLVFDDVVGVSQEIQSKSTSEISSSTLSIKNRVRQRER